MRLLAIADRAPSRPISQILSETPVDAIVTLGDLELHQIRELEGIGLPKLGVYGNHCSGSYMPSLGIENMHLRTVVLGGVTFGGFEGCVRYKESSTAKMYTQEEASALLAEFPRVDVMLVHCPPLGVNDDQTELAHTGFAGLRDYALRERPAFLLHGHTYPTAETMVRRLGETEIVYVFGDGIVEVRA